MTALPAWYQIRVTLNGIKPPIWRRLLVPAWLPLDAFHDVLQISMGWTDSHLHQFVAGSTLYGTADPEFEMEQVKESGVRLADVLKREKDALVYEYDFGDGWEHDIVLEKVLAVAQDYALSCIAGARACPPEDCGGVFGYANLLKIIKRPTHPEYEETIDWLGEGFDPERFDISEVNAVLSGLTIRGLQARSKATRRKRPGA